MVMSKLVAGSFSVALSTNSTLTPIGTQWTLLICPAASAPCQTFASFTAVGASMSLTTAISSQIQSLRFPAGYTARAYGDVEISPLPPPGGTYYNLQTILIRFWNGSIWSNLGTGGGGGGSSHAPANSVQIADAVAGAFNSDPNFTIDPTTHTYNTTTGNMVMGSLTSIPRLEYDPMDTSHLGGLAAAIAGSSGFTPTQVINATIDYGECEKLMGHVSAEGMRIPIPNGINTGIGQIKLWSLTDFGGTKEGTYPGFQHINGLGAMVTVHAPGDTITCSNSVTYNPVPGGVAGVYIHNLRISGIGEAAVDGDIGIAVPAVSSAVENIEGYQNGFANAAVTSINSTSVFLKHIGYPGGQVKGCGAYVTGLRPVSGAPGGNCGAIMEESLDGGGEDFYATDGATGTPRGTGSCYPNCAAVVLGGSGTYDYNIFAQVSDVGVLFANSSIKADKIRVDYTAREGIKFAGILSGDIVSDIVIDSSCTDAVAFQSNFNAGLPTGCAAMAVNNGGNIISGLIVKNSGAILAPSYNQCNISDGITGFAGASNVYDLTYYQGNTGNTGNANGNMFCGNFFGDQTSGRAVFPTMAPMQATGATANVNGINSIVLNGQTLNTVIGGIPGQHLTISGPGTVHYGTGNGTNNMQNQNGLDNSFGGEEIAEYVNTGQLPVLIAGI